MAPCVSVGGGGGSGGKGSGGKGGGGSGGGPIGHQEFRNLWARLLGYQDDATFLNSLDTQPCFKR